MYEPRTSEDRLTDQSALTVSLAIHTTAPLRVNDPDAADVTASAAFQPEKIGMKVETWEHVTRLRKWLDMNAAPTLAEDAWLLRMLKISEELGEVAEALHGTLGVNPREGAFRDWGDLA
ncbi:MULTISPECIES: hypothetical protein [unclassified Streptomyces]|uniref:hypothetical protein n=1 Tax=unclassified Streptomyces TaxID=2593676 RepID=UPI002E2E3F6A|nr:hypothetical protein [Streptomyces sp. NBC_00273]